MTNDTGAIVIIARLLRLAVLDIFYALTDSPAKTFEVMTVKRRHSHMKQDGQKSE